MKTAATLGFRVGIVDELDATTARVRVIFPDYDQMQSYWLPIVVPKTQNDKAYWIPDLGEQVICLMDSRDEAGAVLGAIYSSTDTTPVASANKWHVGFADGASFEYDRALHILDLRFADASDLRYDATQHMMLAAYQDGSSFRYDAGAHEMTIAFDDGATIEYSANAHVFTLGFQDEASFKYDGGAHVLTLVFEDGASITYDAGAHQLAITSEGSVHVTSTNGATISDSSEIKLISGSSQVTLSPQGVAITPPLPTTSTVAQT
ncbi:MAG TPA: phage baseplate assembly protein V [Candidatus Binataceae bacterium]|nr:phage baseplate assembly protein V [Candidatus Binataceae bacterium]